MRKDFEKLYTYLEAPLPPNDLFEKVMRPIHRKERARAVKRTLFYSFGTAVSLAAFIFSLERAWAGFDKSGFFHFLSLLFSDYEIVAVYWKSFTVTLLEALPITNLILVLGATLILMNSLRSWVKYINITINYFKPLKYGSC